MTEITCLLIVFGKVEDKSFLAITSNAPFNLGLLQSTKLYYSKKCSREQYLAQRLVSGLCSLRFGIGYFQKADSVPQKSDTGGIYT